MFKTAVYMFCLCFLAQQKAHPDKVTQNEEEATKDPAIRKSIKEAAAEVEKSEGRGQLKVTSCTSDTKVKGSRQYLIHLNVLYCHFPAGR